MKGLISEVKKNRAELIKELEGNYTETEKVILNRRSVRWYKQEQVPEFMIKRILEAGRFAPSGGNVMPWKFIVIRDPQIIDNITKDAVKVIRLVKALIDYTEPGKGWKLHLAKLLIRIEPHFLHPIPTGANLLIANGKLGLFHGAPTIILIFKDVRGVTPDLDCGIAGQNMALAAHSMGLGTCWVSFCKMAFERMSKWNKFFGIEYPYKFVTSLAMGWPMGKPDGPVERSSHPVDWYENGARSIVDACKGDSHISFGEKITIPNYIDPQQTKVGEMIFDYDKCDGCGSCARICPGASIEINNKKARMTDVVYCMACGDCMAICPKDAIRLKSSYKFSRHYKTIDHGEPLMPRMKY